MVSEGRQRTLAKACDVVRCGGTSPRAAPTVVAPTPSVSLVLVGSSVPLSVAMVQPSGPEHY